MKRALLLAAMPAAAAAPAQAPPVQRGGADAMRDPDATICRSQATIGSRLTRHRICATGQQWLDQQRMDRRYTEKAQTNRIWPGQ